VRVFTEAGIHLSGDTALAQKYVSRARTLLGMMKSVNNGLAVQSWHRRLDQYATVHLSSIYGQDLIHITANPTTSDDGVCPAGLVVVPISDAALSGWGEPYIPPMGTVGAPENELLFKYDADTSTLGIVRGQLFEEVPASANSSQTAATSTDFLYTWHSLGDKKFTWPILTPLISASHNPNARYATTRYNGHGHGSSIYSCGKLWTNTPGLMCGMCIYSNRLYVATYGATSDTLVIYERPYKETYSSLGGDYDVKTNPTGWQITLSYTIGQVLLKANASETSTMLATRMYGTVAGSETTGKMVVGYGGYTPISDSLDSLGYLSIDLASKTVSKVGRSTIGVTTKDFTNDWSYGLEITGQVPIVVETWPSGATKRMEWDWTRTIHSQSTDTTSLTNPVEQVVAIDYSGDTLLKATASAASSTLLVRDLYSYVTSRIYGWSNHAESGYEIDSSHSYDTSTNGHETGGKRWNESIVELDNIGKIYLSRSGSESGHSFTGYGSEYYFGGVITVTGTGFSIGASETRLLAAVDMRVGSALVERLVSEDSSYTTTRDQNTQTKSPGYFKRYQDLSDGGTEIQGFSRLTVIPGGTITFDGLDAYETPWTADPPEGISSGSSTSTTSYRDSGLSNIKALYLLIAPQHFVTRGLPVVDYGGNIFISHPTIVDQGWPNTIVTEADEDLPYINYYGYYSDLNSAVGIYGDNPKYKDIKLI